MRKTCWTLVCFWCLTVLTACSGDDLEKAGPASDWIEISANIISHDRSHKNTKANISPDGKGAFTEGDRIQLFVTPEYSSSPSSTSQLALNGGIWTPRLTWEQIEGNEPQFSAFFPALEKSYGSYPVKVDYDQSKKGSLQRADLLCARTTVKRGNAVVLDFEHIMSRLSVRLASNTLTENELSKAVVEVYATTQAQIDPTTGKFIKYDYSHGLQRRIRLAYVGGGEFQAILIPQPIIDEWKEWTPWMTVSIGGKAKNIKAPSHLKDGAVFNELQPGKETVLNISIDKENVEIWADKVHWVYGVNNPDMDSDLWGYAFVNPQDHSHRIIGLTWKREYGWFDCNKKDPVSGTYDDNNMCWAATSSNMVHWWMTQNKGYIERYGEFTGPYKYNSALDSEIFEHYKKHYPNEGFYLPNGVNWFFTRENFQQLPGGGFFKNVFGEKSMVRVEGFDNKDDQCKKRFTEAFKTAFRNKEAIGCSFILPSGNAHAITFWGAEFDAEGFVTALYMVENNDRDWDEQEIRYFPDLDRPLIPAGLFRKPVKYSNGHIWMESAAKDGFTQQVSQLVFLGLHRQEWEDYLSAHNK